MSQRPGRSKTSLGSPTFLSLHPSSTSLPGGSGGHCETQDHSVLLLGLGFENQAESQLPCQVHLESSRIVLVPAPGFSWGHRACCPQLVIPVPGCPPPSFREPRAAVPLLHSLCMNPAVRWLPQSGPYSAVSQNQTVMALDRHLSCDCWTLTSRHWRIPSLETTAANTPVSEMQDHNPPSGQAKGVSGEWFPGFVQRPSWGWWSTVAAVGGLDPGRLCEGGSDVLGMCRGQTTSCCQHPV